MLSTTIGGDLPEILSALLFAAVFFVAGVGFACYRAVSWVERMKTWARVVTITESELDTLNGATGTVDVDVAEIAGGVVLVVTPDCSEGTENPTAGATPADPSLFVTNRLGVM